MRAAGSGAARRRRLAAGVAVASLALAGCAPRLAPTRGILVLSLDTLRADRLGAYGHTRDTSPFLDSLAARGVLFEEAIAQYPSTLVSHMSIFTGLYPREHAVFPPRGQLAATIPTIAELLQRAGYRTAGFTEGGQMRGKHGFERGFDHFDDRAQRRFDDVERTLARGLGFLRSLQPDDRYFLFLHTYAIHTPYEPPPPYDTLYWKAAPPDVFAPTGRNFLRLNSHRLTIEPAAVEYFQALYDGSIRYVDDRLRQFFAELEALGLADDLTVVVTSDHGEEFLEHGRLAHTQAYRETLHVPLIVVHPGMESARRVTPLVESVDLAPTVLELAGLKANGMSGRSLHPWLAGGDPTPRGQAYSEVMAAGVPTRSLHRESDAGLFQLVHTRYDGTQAKERITDFDVGSSALAMRVASFLGAPRRVEIRIDGELHESLALADEGGVRVVLPADPRTPRRRVRIEADSCTPLQRRRPHVNCYSYLLTADQELQRVELFELRGDPLAQRDAWPRHSALGRQMLQVLNALDWQPRAAPGDLEIDRESRRQLEALGYL
ncbi:MAG: sulfatase [Thermoanaerobaculia bacterium]|nr:sulfatase [Thermoanaerobaculia bacterium]